MGMVPAPAVTERRPWRVPGAEGAKARVTVQMTPPARTEGQLVVSVKSPERLKERVKGWVPVFDTVRFCVMAEVPVTTTALGKLRVVGETLRLGLAMEPLMPGWGRVLPVTRTERP